MKSRFKVEQLIRILLQAKEIIENWKNDYNYFRSHSSLNYLAPNQFKQ